MELPMPLEGDPLSAVNLRIRDIVAYAILSERGRSQPALEEAQKRLEELASELAVIRGSLGWRLMVRVQRLITQLIPSPARRVVRRSAQLIYSTLRGRLAAQLRVERSRAAARAKLDAAERAKTEPPQAARELGVDQAIALPFVAGPPEFLPQRVAAVVHLYHEELAAEFRRYLLNIPVPVDVYISTTDEHRAELIRSAFLNWPLGSVEVRVVENRGRDIAPKLVTFADIYSKYEFVVYLHSKRSHHSGVLALWRLFLLETLIGSRAIIESIFYLFHADPKLGIVAAQHYEPMRQWINWGGNLLRVKELAGRMGIDLPSDFPVLDFPAGSMFWTRTDALRPLLELGLTNEDFSPESGQIDGTLAHAVERIFYFVCEHAGFKWLKVARPELHEHTPNIVSVINAQSVAREIDGCTFRLLRPGAVRPRATPLDPVTRAPQKLTSILGGAALGFNLKPPTRPYQVAVGLLTYENDGEELKRSAHAALLSIDRDADWIAGHLAILDNGSDTSNVLPSTSRVLRYPTQGNIGFGAGHNVLMRTAFKNGADVYFAVNPDGILHPDAILNMLRVLRATDDRALVEASQFPIEHPKPYDPVTLETPWVSGACLAIPRAAFMLLDGFDEGFFMYCEDVDLSWRARAQGIPLRICPRALFLHKVTNRATDSATHLLMLESGVRLARKWQSPDFENFCASQLPETVREAMTNSRVNTVPDAWRRYANFDNDFKFAPPRW
ncbi:MAG: hypothetical protein JSR41_11550 [Proteobacteria bacterium]|nr:hypothetical protein [Pseudomonadota bacterium]